MSSSSPLFLSSSMSSFSDDGSHMIGKPRSVGVGVGASTGVSVGEGVCAGVGLGVRVDVCVRECVCARLLREGSDNAGFRLSNMA